jgi:ABC-2 type transport system ATP-binding protein
MHAPPGRSGGPIAEPAAIEVEDLEVVRGGKRVLPGISLRIAAGAVTGLLGPSGSGKSTLIRAIAGVQIVAGGRVSVLGAPAGGPSLRPRVGYVTQAPSVYGDLTVRENLHYFARILDVGEERIREVIEAVGLGGEERQVVNTLSGGQLSRASLATALLNRPEVLLLDEPTVGLDPVLRASLWRTFAELAAGGTTLLVSSHVMDEASHCDSLLLMREGRIAFEGPPALLRERTGTADLEEAFLRLIEGGATGETAGAER